uniref:BED-type domain-containing protein n=1 Tax=Cucumis melo TaxID=3656 RepID=A0A9I9ECG1_CUCME
MITTNRTFLKLKVITDKGIKKSNRTDDPNRTNSVQFELGQFLTTIIFCLLAYSCISSHSVFVYCSAFRFRVHFVFTTSFLHFFHSLFVILSSPHTPDCSSFRFRPSPFRCHSPGYGVDTATENNAQTYWSCGSIKFHNRNEPKFPTSWVLIERFQFISNHYMFRSGCDPKYPRAACKHCGASYVCDSKRNGTTNLKRHLEKCKMYVNPLEDNVEGEGDSESSMMATSFTQENCRTMFAKMKVKGFTNFAGIKSQVYDSIKSNRCK